MPYSSDPKRFQQMAPYLECVKTGARGEITITRGNAQTVAFRLREALRMAEFEPMNYPEYGLHAGIYSVKIINASLIHLVPRTGLLTAEELANLVQPPNPVHLSIDAVAEELKVRRAKLRAIPLADPLPPGNSPTGKHTVRLDPEDYARARGITVRGPTVGPRPTHLDGPQTDLSIIDAYMRYGGVKPTLNFPKADLDPEELFRVWKWAETHSPKLMLMVAEESLTVAIWDAVVADYSWKPDPGIDPEAEDEGE